MKPIIVVDRPEAWPLQIENVKVISARTYLTDPDAFESRPMRVLNLCRSYRYQGLGYYVSLLAEARGHTPMPDIGVICDLGHRGILRMVSDDLDKTIQKSLSDIKAATFTLSIYFGRNLAKRHNALAQKLFSHFKAPMLRAQFVRKDDEWELKSIFPIAIKQVPDSHLGFLKDAVAKYFSSPTRTHRHRTPRYQMAILVDPNESTPPSNEKALECFIKAAGKLDIEADLITQEDLYRLPSYDALFIRETTSVNNHTFRFARQAEKDGLVVIDDPKSILRCTNKVFLKERLDCQRIPTPKSMILHRHNLEEVIAGLGLPCIIKTPDSSFSKGVFKAETEQELRTMVKEILTTSDLVLAQEFVPTPFDWRVGVLDGEALYACKYFMHGEHWQIYETSQSGELLEGEAETLRVEDAPKRVIQCALRVASLIGKGLYGVDLKEINGRPSVIEVNDNPSIDAGCEDLVLGQALYDRIMETFNQRLNQRVNG